MIARIAAAAVLTVFAAGAAAAPQAPPTGAQRSGRRSRPGPWQRRSPDPAVRESRRLRGDLRRDDDEGLARRLHSCVGPCCRAARSMLA